MNQYGLCVGGVPESLQVLSRARLASVLYTVMVVKSVLCCCGLALLLLHTNKTSRTPRTSTTTALDWRCCPPEPADPPRTTIRGHHVFMSSCHHVIHFYSPHSSALFPPQFGPEYCSGVSRFSVSCFLVCSVAHVSSNTLPSFKQALKTHLFKIAYNT